MGSSPLGVGCIQKDLGQEELGGNCWPEWGGPAPSAPLCQVPAWGLALGNGTTVTRRVTRPIWGHKLTVPPPSSPRWSWEGHQRMGMPEVTGPRVPWVLRGPRGPGSAGKLGLNWEQVLGMSQRRREGWGCREPGSGCRGTGGHSPWGERGTHLEAEGWQEASRWLAPPMLGRLGVPGGALPLPDVVQLSLALPLPPRPPGSSPLRFLSRESGGDPPPAPRSSSPGFLSWGVWLLPCAAFSLLAHPLPISSPTSPWPLAPFLLPPAAPQLPDPGGSRPSAASRSRAASCAPALCHGAELTPLPGAERRAGRWKHQPSFIAFFPPLLPKHFAFSPQRRGWVGRILSSTQPAPAPWAEKSWESRSERGRGLPGSVGCGSQGRCSLPAALADCGTQIGFRD